MNSSLFQNQVIDVFGMRKVFLKRSNKLDYVHPCNPYTTKVWSSGYE